MPPCWLVVSGFENFLPGPEHEDAVNRAIETSALIISINIVELEYINQNGVSLEEDYHPHFVGEGVYRECQLEPLRYLLLDEEIGYERFFPGIWDEDMSAGIERGIDEAISTQPLYGTFRCPATLLAHDNEDVYWPTQQELDDDIALGQMAVTHAMMITGYGRD